MFRQVNRAWLRLHGYDSADEVVSRHFALTRVEDGMATAQANARRLLSGEVIPSGETAGLWSISTSVICWQRELSHVRQA